MGVQPNLIPDQFAQPSRSGPRTVQPDIGESVDEFEHGKLIFNKPGQSWHKKLLFFATGLVLSNLSRSTWDLVEIWLDLFKIWSNPAKTSKFRQNLVDFCKIQQRFAHSETNQDPTRNQWYPTTRTAAFGGLAVGLGIRDPEWLGQFRVRHKPNPWTSLPDPSSSIHVFLCFLSFVFDNYNLSDFIDFPIHFYQNK